MPVLPDDLNPLRKEDIYKKLKVEPYASDDDIAKGLKKLGLESLPKEEKEKEVESIKKIIKILKNPSSRVRLNAFILDPVDKKTVAERLKHLPNLKTENVQLPKPDLNQVFIEARCEAFAERDFAPINKTPQLDVEFDKINEILKKQTIEKHIFFDT